MKTIDAMKAITKAYTNLRNIENDEDLKKAKLSLSDYYAAKDLFKELSTPGHAARSFIKNVALFYENCNFNVIEENGIYIIFTEA